MLDDILGTGWDQCRSTVQYSFTSTETRRLVRTDSPGRPPRLSHSSWTMTPFPPLSPSLINILVSVDVKQNNSRHWFVHRSMKLPVTPLTQSTLSTHVRLSSLSRLYASVSADCHKPANTRLQTREAIVFHLHNAVGRKRSPVSFFCLLEEQ